MYHHLHLLAGRMNEHHAYQVKIMYNLKGKPGEFHKIRGGFLKYLDADVTI